MDAYSACNTSLEVVEAQKQFLAKCEQEILQRQQTLPDFDDDSNANFVEDDESEESNDDNDSNEDNESGNEAEENSDVEEQQDTVAEDVEQQ